MPISPQQRGWWGYETVKANQKVKGYGDLPLTSSEMVIPEVMSDLMHYADMEGLDAEKIMLKAFKYYNDEKEAEI